MMQNSSINNEVTLSGKITSIPEFSHEVYGEKFYNFVLKVPRLSESYDFINVTVSDRLMYSTDINFENTYVINGQFRSYNNYSEQGNKLILTVFARDISTVDDAASVNNPNVIYLNGFVCKQPVYRVTPFGREITDLLLAINRSYNKSDYIPCIAWGRNARFASKFNLGDNIKIHGRVQSREYQKKLSEDEIITKTAYEVSISKLEFISMKNDAI